MSGGPSPGMGRIACIGEVMIELVVGEGSEARIGVAGDTYNTAVYLRRLLDPRDWSVSFLTVLGRDTFSDRILGEMAGHGLGTDAVARHDTRTPGLYAIETDETGERHFSYWRSDSAARTLFSRSVGDPAAIAGTLGGYDMVFLSGISLAILPGPVRATLAQALALVRETGTYVAFDSNYRPRLWSGLEEARRVAETLWRTSDIALPSLDDERQLFGDATEAAVVARHRGYGALWGVLKRGAQGPLAIAPEADAPDFAPAPDVVDTTAAGDSFNAGFLAATLSGLTVEEAMRQGHDLASRVVGRRGAIIDP